MKVLMVSAHADDAEVSCGGTAIKLIEQFGARVWSVYFCPCLWDPKNSGHLEQHKKVVKSLGIEKLIGFNFHSDIIEQYKQPIRNRLFKIKKTFKPDVVLCPSPNDLHQDHRVVSDCCLTIFRDTSTILGYEVLRSVGPKFNANTFIILTPSIVREKLRILEKYKAQIAGRSWFKTENFLAQMKARGVQAGDEYAEVFELLWGRFK